MTRGRNNQVKDKMKKENLEEESRIRKKILSNLCFIEIDLSSIERLKLKKDIRKVVEGIRERVDSLKEKLLKEEKNEKNRYSMEP